MIERTPEYVNHGYKGPKKAEICEKKVSPALNTDYNYSLLYETLMGAYYQASEGKGKERHATGEAFQDQLIMLIERFDIGFQRGQAVKKIVESKRLEATSKEAAVRELRGAIVYCSAKIIGLEGGENESAVFSQT